MNTPPNSGTCQASDAAEIQVQLWTAILALTVYIRVAIPVHMPDCEFGFRLGAGLDQREWGGAKAPNHECLGMVSSTYIPVAKPCGDESH